MATRLHRYDQIEILSGLVATELFEGLDDDRTLEEQVLIGTALKQLADEIDKSARAQALRTYGGTTGKQIDGRLLIEWRPGTTTTRVDSAAVRKDLPPDQYPMYWKESAVKESLRITIAEYWKESAVKRSLGITTAERTSGNITAASSQAPADLPWD